MTDVWSKDCIHDNWKSCWYKNRYQKCKELKEKVEILDLLQDAKIDAVNKLLQIIKDKEDKLEAVKEWQSRWSLNLSD